MHAKRAMPWQPSLTGEATFLRPCLQGSLHSAGRSPGSRIINVNVNVSASTAAALDVYGPSGQDCMRLSVTTELQEPAVSRGQQRQTSARSASARNGSRRAHNRRLHSALAQELHTRNIESARTAQQPRFESTPRHGRPKVADPFPPDQRRSTKDHPSSSSSLRRNDSHAITLPFIEKGNQGHGHVLRPVEPSREEHQSTEASQFSYSPHEGAPGGQPDIFQHSYFQRQDVQNLMRRLRREQPSDLTTWLQAYCKPFAREEAALDKDSAAREVGSKDFSMQEASHCPEPEEEAESPSPKSPESPSPKSGHAGSTLRRAASMATLNDSMASNSSTAASFGGVYSYGVLDWRFFIFNAEQEVLLMTRAAQRTANFDVNVKPAVARLHAFLPHTIRNAILAGNIQRSDTNRVVSETPIMSTYDPVIACFDAAVVFADASGFTKLTETLANMPNGAEKIGACLNGFFDPLIEIVVRYGGDVLKFSGDALTIIWPGDVFGPVAAAAAACFCCLQIQAQVDSFGITPVPGLRLTLHNGIGFGQLRVMQLGGLMNRWEYCAAGPPLEQVAIAEPLAKSGETVTSPSIQQILENGAHEQCQDAFIFEPLLGDGAPPGYSRLVHRPGAELRDWDLEPPSTKSVQLDRTLVERYIPHAIMRRIEGAIDLEAEMRRVSVIFFSIEGLNPGTNGGDAVRTQLLLRLLQRSVYALEGSVNKFLVDDKGMLLLVVFGLPPLNHFADDPLRAVLAAARFTDTLREENLHGRAGVTTGKVWCGVVGSELRREYSVLGDTVNLSARLMANADSKSVLVDNATYQVCCKFLSFQALGSIQVKGKSEDVTVFQFTGELVKEDVRERNQLQPKLISWQGWPVREQLLEALESQLSHPDGPGGVVLVHGASGSGKQEACELVKMWASEKGFALVSGQNMSPTATIAVPRLCWQEVFGDLVELAETDPYWQRRLQEEFPGESQNQNSHHLFQLLLVMLRDASAPKELLPWAPLLNLVLPRLDFGPKVVSAMLERDEQHTVARAPRLAELCAKVLDSFTIFGGAAGTVVLVHIKRSTSVFQMTDQHDEFIALAVAQLCIHRRKEHRQGRPLILCMVSRQDTFQHCDLQPNGEGVVINCNSLSRSETENYMEHYLGARGGVSPSLLDHVHRVSGGNPFGIEALLTQLEQLNTLQVSPTGVMTAACGSEGLSKLEYPEILVGMEFARFEKLSAAEQEILKAAATFVQVNEDVGGVFRPLELQENLNTAMPTSLLVQHCTRLVQLNILCAVHVEKKRMTRKRSRKTAQRASDIRPQQRGSVPERESLPDLTPRKRSSLVGGLAREVEFSRRSSNKSTNGYRFASELLRHVANTLVLQVQRKQMKRFQSEVFDDLDESDSSDDMSGLDDEDQEKAQVATASYIKDTAPFLPT